jgi:hypothetical protein
MYSRLYEYPKGETLYWASVRATLGDYVKGEEIPDDDSFFKRLNPKNNDIWEIRILGNPQSRLFGAWADADCFVAFTGRLRENCPFDQGIRIVHEKWYDLFGGHRRYRCWPLNQCITNFGDQL